MINSDLIDEFGSDNAPIYALTNSDRPAVLAVITRVDGPSYRPLGAMMVLFADGGRTGTLSSGCIEADLAIHAEAALADTRPVTVTYGRGSPYIDIQLPCGGGLDILLVPNPDRSVIAKAKAALSARKACTLIVDPASGAMSFAERGETGMDAGRFRVRLQPELRFYVFGKGPEATTFAALVQSAGFPNLLLSPDEETRAHAKRAGCDTRALVAKSVPADMDFDTWTSVTLFFHDHDWEPEIIRDALATPAFYVGAQGSRKARDTRNLELKALDVPQAAIARIHGPIGLIPSVRDPRTLAVSVLAEVLDAARSGDRDEQTAA